MPIIDFPFTTSWVDYRITVVGLVQVEHVSQPE